MGLVRKRKRSAVKNLEGVHKNSMQKGTGSGAGKNTNLDSNNHTKPETFKNVVLWWVEGFDNKTVLFGKNKINADLWRNYLLERSKTINLEQSRSLFPRSTNGSEYSPDHADSTKRILLSLPIKLKVDSALRSDSDDPFLSNAASRESEPLIVRFFDQRDKIESLPPIFPESQEKFGFNM